jgi:hypothetical protein
MKAKKMNLNPKIFEGFVDPDGGEWIRIKSGIYANTVWRPHDLNLSEDGRVEFKVEFFQGPGFNVPVETDRHFENVAGSVMQELIQEAAAQEVAQTQLNEQTPKNVV